jgi:murein DD-endopeptidase MepM/ murein hydrolase activator NlpD
MASNKKNRYNLSKGRKEQLAQARQNAKDDYNRRQKEKQNKALIQQFNATHKNAPKQTISAKGGNRNTRHSTGTTRSTVSKTRMNGSLGNSFGGSKTGGAKTTTDRRANAAHKADTERRQSTTLRQGSSYLTGGSTRKATPYAAAQQVYTPLRSNDRRARAGRAADANRTINARNQMATTKTGTGKTWNEKEERQKAIDTLNANSMAWHNTSDEVEKTRLHAANDRIRKKFGMTYNGDTGATYLPKASGGKTNVSKPVVETARNAAFGQNYQTQEQRQSRYDELNNEIDRMQKQYPYLISMDMKNRNAGEKLAAVPWLISHPKLAAAGINGDDQYSKMSTTNKKQADAMYQLYKRLNDEADAISKQSAGKAWGSGVANAALNAAGAVENGARYATSAAENALSGALKLAGKQDAGQFWEDVAKNTVNTSFADSAMQKVNDWAQPVGSAKKAQELAGSGARMLPGMALGAATGTASKVSSLLDKAPLANASLAAIFGDSAASGAREALNDGASLNQALAYGAGSGLTEVGTEKMFGGIPGLNEGVAKLGSKSRILNKAFDVLGEGVEEAASTLIDPYLKRATYDKNAKNATAQELWDSAKGGMALAGIMQGANAVSERLANRRYGTAPAETTTSIHDANADVRAAEQMDNRLHPNTSQALPTAQRLALPEGNTRTANTLYANENGGVANNLRAFNNADTPDVLYGNMRGDFTSAPDSGSVLYASQNGQVSQTLPTGYLPVGRSGLTKVAAQVDETQTIPRFAVDDAGNPNGGLSDAEMQWAKLLAANQEKTGVSIQQLTHEIVDSTFEEYNQALQSAEQYVRDYTPQGTSVVWNADGTSFRASNNEKWYSDYYKKNGKAPSRAEAAQVAAQLVKADIQRGGGQFISAELAQDLQTALEIQAAANALGENVISAQVVDGNLVVQRGKPAYTANIQDTNARLDRNIISPVMQGATAAPINLSPMQRTGQTQSAPTLADVQQARNDIMPKLTRAGAETVQTGVQTAPPEITQPMQENAQGAAQQADINPKLTKAEVNAESSVGAAETGFDPYSKMVNDYGAIPEGMNPARMVDVPQSTNGTDRVSNVARTIMESGVTPDNLIPVLENHVAEGLFSHDVKSLKKTLSGATKTIQKKGWQGAFDQWEEVTDGRRAVTDDDIALGQMMYTAAVEAGDTQTAMKLAGDLAVQGTALGRGVNAFKLLKKTTPEGQLYYLQKAVQKIQQEYQSRFDKQAGKAAKKQGVPAEDIADQYGLKLNEDLVQEFLNAETQEARDAVVDKIYNDVAQQIPKTAGDRLNAWRYFAMLGNPRTHIRNIMGNVASAAALDTSHKVSAVGQKFLPKEKRTRALHTSKAAKQFAKADYANVETELSGNAYKTEMSDIKQRQKLFPKPLQKVMDANTWALDAEDQVFKKKSYIDSMGNFLTARGWDVNNLTESQLNEARQHAIQDAKIATFQDASKLADKLSEIEHSGKAWGVAIGSLVPFKRTPINVAKRSFELSPVGLLKAITYDAAQVKKGNMDATKMIDHIGQGLTGSGVAVLGAFLAAQGIFSAGSSDDDKEANFDAGMGQQEYAINIGGKSYTIDWASPAVVPLAMGGELYEALHQKYDDEETAFNQAMATVSRMFDPMLNMTMLSGIGSTVTSAAYNKSNPLFGIASNIATNFGGQFVPTLFGQVARTVDNTRRTTYADKNSPVPSSVQKFLQRQANKIPGLSQYQPAYTDVWGREQKNGPDNVFARAAYNFFSPGYLADAKGTQAEKALKELYQATGDNSVLPSKPQKYYKDADGVKKFLSASEYSKLTSEGGKISLDAIDKLTKSEAYKQMSNDERIEAVADIYKYAKDVAANKTYGKELDGTTKLVKESGMEPGLYYAYKEMQSNFKASMENYEAFDQTFLAIKNDKSLSEQEKNSLYHNLLIKGNDEATWKKYTEISDKVTAEEFVDALTQVKYIKGIGKEELSDETGAEQAKAEATEFSKYLDMMGYTGEKRAALEDKFGFYSMIRQDPQNYTFDMLKNEGNTYERDAISAVESSGMSASQYNQIKTLANRLQAGVDYEKGKSGAKKAAQAKIVSQNVDNYDQYAAVMSALGLKRFDSLYSSGGKLPKDSGLNTGINVNRSSASQKTSSAGFVNPTTASNSVVTSGYGGRNAVKTSTGYSSTDHDGIDIGGTGGNLNGQAADSIGGGKVTEVGYDENGYGNYVVVDHGNGYTSLYGHLQKATVKQGDTVSAGQQVGVIGSTGSSSAPHLHLRVHKNGQSIDPRTVIPGYK